MESENNLLQVKLKSQELALQELDQKQREFQVEMTQRDTEITELRRKVKAKDETIEKMANASMKLKSRLAKFEVELCRFTVDKIFSGFPPSTAIISMLQDVKTKKIQFHCIVNGKRIFWPTEDISSFSSSELESNKFFVTFKNSRSQEVFLSNVRDEVKPRGTEISCVGVIE
eukprot:TRINITY_DN3640_c0_g1_i1.p1 TRINITY_DN3640_c0_g1~~TRINITY_DN3640_c0_g1_i1.p1  ORF type:complete len:172 (+),score=38.54 TRINITY_DN3640_c0_g1_i1:840-1355(+)